MKRHGLPIVLVTAFLGTPAVAAPVATPEWQSGFEQGFPGEFLDYDDGSWSGTGSVNAGRNEVWTIVDDSDPLVMHGTHAYKGWPVAAQEGVHRCYPVVHFDPGIGPVVVNSFLAYVEVDYSALSAQDWVHLFTYANNPDWDVFTMSIRDRRLEMAHLDWTYIGPTPQPDFPVDRWVRITSYMEFNGADTYIRVWQDGTAIFEGTYTAVAGTRLMRAHWGWYSSGPVSQGSQYNDEIQLWTLSAPLVDLDSEPESPYGTPMGTGGSGGMGTGGGMSGGSGGDAGEASGGTTSSGGSNSSGGTMSSGGSNSSGGTMSNSGGSGGTGTGGSGGSGAATSAGRGGAPGSGGAGANAGAGAALAATNDDGGCSCRVAGHTTSGSTPAALSLLGLGFFGRWRRQRRAQR